MQRIDANVILRYLLNDHMEMSAQAEQVIREGADTMPEVLAEVVYVLRGVYHASRENIAEVLTHILSVVSVEHDAVMVRAVQIFADSSLDFVDCILIAYHEIEHVEVFSFDKKLMKRIL